MHFSDIFKHKDKTAAAPAPKEGEVVHKEDKHHHHERKHIDASVPKGFANDAMRNSNTPDHLYQFDDPTARRLGPLASTDPTNTGA